jgi:hypothetical protein
MEFFFLCLCRVLECVFQNKLFMILHPPLALILTEIQTDCYKAILQTLHYTRVKRCLLFVTLKLLMLKAKRVVDIKQIMFFVAMYNSFCDALFLRELRIGATLSYSYVIARFL